MGLPILLLLEVLSLSYRFTVLVGWHGDELFGRVMSWLVW